MSRTPERHGLESVKKTDQVADVGKVPARPARSPFNRDPTGFA
jgi:hypothetical protein